MKSNGRKFRLAYAGVDEYENIPEHAIEKDFDKYKSINVHDLIFNPYITGHDDKWIRMEDGNKIKFPEYITYTGNQIQMLNYDIYKLQKSDIILPEGYSTINVPHVINRGELFILDEFSLNHIRIKTGKRFNRMMEHALHWSEKSFGKCYAHSQCKEKCKGIGRVKYINCMVSYYYEHAINRRDYHE